MTERGTVGMNGRILVGTTAAEMIRMVVAVLLFVLPSQVFNANGQTTNVGSTAYVAHIKPPSEAVFFDKPFFVVLVIEERMPAELPNQDAFVMTSPTNAPYMHFAHSGQSFEQNRVWQDVVSLTPVKLGTQQLGPFRIHFRGYELTTDTITIDVLSTNVLDAIKITLSTDKT